MIAALAESWIATARETTQRCIFGYWRTIAPEPTTRT